MRGKLLPADSEEEDDKFEVEIDPDGEVEDDDAPEGDGLIRECTGTGEYALL